MVEVVVTSGDALHPLLKQEQHHTRVVPAGFQYLHGLRLTNLSRPTHPKLMGADSVLSYMN